MLYREIPKTGDKVSALGFGCMRLPVIDNDQTKIDEEKSIEMLRYAIDNGVNYIDTAYPYHGTGMAVPGMSEPFVGKLLQDGYREKVKLATKLPSWLVQSREDMDKFLNQQLERLQTDCIDYYLIHSLSVDLWKLVLHNGVIEFLDKAKKDGRIKHAGFSFHDNSIELFKEIVDAYDWALCQIQYNYVDEFYQAGREGMEYAANKGLGVIVMEPLRGGSLASKLPDEAIKVFRAANPEKSPAEWSLRWIWNQPEVSVVLSGMTAFDQVIENVKVAGDTDVNSMTEVELETIKKVKSILDNRTNVDCTDCGYCMPCPSGVNIPQNFKY
ncbi:MAG: aldo/keto reductase, partial [Draconibacterium sp.]|nr:aldo/keto reductase [Draconibacterium sp.]